MFDELHEILQALFQLLCHQQEGRSWAPGGVHVLVCQRCLGLYAGLFLAVISHILSGRPPRSPRADVLHVLLLLPMVVLGFHLVPHGPLARTISGQLFAIGAVYFAFIPFSRHALDAGAERERRTSYGLLTLASVCLVAVTCRIGDVWAAVFLDLLTVCGLITLVWLIIRTVVLVARAIRRRTPRPRT